MSADCEHKRAFRKEAYDVCMDCNAKTLDGVTWVKAPEPPASAADIQQAMLIETVVKAFNFERLHRAMIAVDWRWQDAGVPSVADLKETARKLMAQALEMKGTARTGGFSASFCEADETDPAELNLIFVFERAWVEL